MNITDEQWRYVMIGLAILAILFAMGCFHDIPFAFGDGAGNGSGDGTDGDGDTNTTDSPCVLTCADYDGWIKTVSLADCEQEMYNNGWTQIEWFTNECCCYDEPEDTGPDYTCGDAYLGYGTQTCEGSCPDGQICLEEYHIIGFLCHCVDVPENLCSDIVIPPDVGDKGGYCLDNGECQDPGDSCTHYWDWNAQTHRCGCATPFYCGQYCYVYDDQSTACDCPPGSFRDWTGLYTFVCIPNSCTCDWGQKDWSVPGTHADVLC